MSPEGSLRVSALDDDYNTTSGDTRQRWPWFVVVAAFLGLVAVLVFAVIAVMVAAAGGLN
jgi:hypothetical protein